LQSSAAFDAQKLPNAEMQCGTFSSRRQRRLSLLRCTPQPIFVKKSIDQIVREPLIVKWNQFEEKNFEGPRSKSVGCAGLAGAIFSALRTLHRFRPRQPHAARPARPDDGSERYRFEVKAIRSEHITDDDGTLFQPPTNYFQARALQD
jgi:hypothetical protein